MKRILQRCRGFPNPCGGSSNQSLITTSTATTTMPTPPSSSVLLPPALLISRRGISSKLFVGGLSNFTTEKYLSEAFSQYGQVIEAKILMDRDSDKTKGFGFVTFASGEEAKSALSDMNGKVLNGRVIFVDHAKPASR